MWDYNDNHKVKITHLWEVNKLPLKAKRILLGIKTQKDLSVLSGVGINTIVKLEKGDIDSVSVKNLKKVAKALNASVQELFFNED